MKDIAIGTINTKPERDPYTDIDGIVSKTILKLNPERGEAWVTQEYNDNSTPADEWHGLVLTWHVPNHSSESEMRRWIEENKHLLLTICNNFTSRWDGNNFIGQLTPVARAAYASIEQELEDGGGPGDYYHAYTVDQWLDGALDWLDADSNDDQLKRMARQLEPDRYSVLIDKRSGINHTNHHVILDYLTARRDELKAEAAA